MSKVTSKLQVTVPKTIADQYRIKPGDEIVWLPAGASIRVLPAAAREEPSVDSRLRLFDEATRRQRKRNKDIAATTGTRGWTRDELYDRGRSR